MVESIKHLYHYLYGRKFTIRTDHGALYLLMNFKNPDGQMARWMEVLLVYDFIILYRSGKSHGNADDLSRRPCGECQYCERKEEREIESTQQRECYNKMCIVSTRKEFQYLIQNFLINIIRLKVKSHNLTLHYLTLGNFQRKLN